MTQHPEHTNRESSFPALPEYEATWWPIYWSPIPGSGERLAVFVVAVGRDGEYCIRQTIREEVLIVMCRQQAAGVTNMLNLVRESLDGYLGASKPMAEWAPLLTGFVVGEGRSSLSDNIRQSAAQGIRLGASLADPAFADLNQA